MRLLATLTALALVAGCSSTPAPAPAPVPAAPAATTAAAPESAAPAAAMDAKTVIGRLKDGDLGLTGVNVQTEDTDPNNLLGRPNGYTSRSSADLPGGDKRADKYGIDRGLVVEVFATAEQAKARADYIANLQKGNSLLGSEWHYFTGGGTALVRVSGKVKPSHAKKVEAAVGKL